MYTVTKGSDFVWVTDAEGNRAWEGIDTTFLIVEGKPKKVLELPEGQILEALIAEGIITSPPRVGST
jgi:hypothetical protein